MFKAKTTVRTKSSLNWSDWRDKDGFHWWFEDTV